MAMVNKYRVSLNGVEIDLKEKENTINIDNYNFTPEVIYNGKYYRVFIEGKELNIKLKDNRIFLDGKEVDFDFQFAPTITAKKNLQNKKVVDIKAAIPGKIIEVKVSKGQIVRDQECLLVLESMKMRNEILSPINGVVDTIFITDGDQVISKQMLLKIKPIKKSKEAI